MWTTLETAEKVTLIGIMITFLIGLCNLLFSMHKNRVDFISQNRMQWIKEVRGISSKILSWKYTTGTTNEVLSLINELIMYLNISNSIDEKINTELLKMYDCAYKLSFFDNFKTKTSKKLFEEYFSHKEEFRTLIRIYLKKEWIRVKVESQVIKIPFVHYWIPILGFNEKWATKELMKQYKNIKQYKFNPWIAFSPEEQQEIGSSELTSVFIEDGNRFLMLASGNSEDRAALARKRLREELLQGSATEMIQVPDGKLAGGEGTIIGNEERKKEQPTQSLVTIVPDGKFG